MNTYSQEPLITQPLNNDQSQITQNSFRNNRKLTMFLFLVIIFISIGIGGYVAGSKSNTSNNLLSTNNTTNTFENIQSTHTPTPIENKTSSVQTLCQTGTLSIQKIKDLCNVSNGELIIKYDSLRLQNQQYALVLLDARTVEEWRNARDYIESMGGRMVHSFPTHVMIGTVPKDISSQLVGKYNIQGIYYDKIDINLVSTYGETAKGLIESWNGDKEEVYCKCSEDKTWSCNGCIVLNPTVCKSGQGEWVSNQCSCREGQHWEKSIGSCVPFLGL